MLGGVVSRVCDVCGAPYEAIRPNARYCSPACRKRLQRHPEAALVSSAQPELGGEGSGPTVVAVRTELAAAGRDTTYLGSIAVALADRMDGSRSIMGYAAMAKELRSTMDQALAGVKAAADPVDELRARRDRIRDAG